MTNNKIAEYVESLVTDELTDVITDITKTSRHINKLDMYIDELEDKKIVLLRKLDNMDADTSRTGMKNNVTDCNRAIRRIQNDISYVKSSSFVFAFLAEAKKFLSKDIITSIISKVNANILINTIEIGTGIIF